MPGTTPILGLPFPSPPDPADVPADMEALARAIDTLNPASKAAGAGTQVFAGAVAAGSSPGSPPATTGATMAAAGNFGSTTAAASGAAFDFRAVGDTFARLRILTNGEHQWSSGAAAPDLFASRASAGVLSVLNGLQLGGLNQAVQTRLTVGKATASALSNLPWIQCGSGNSDNDLVLVHSASGGGFRFFAGGSTVQSDQPGTGTNREIAQWIFGGAASSTTFRFRGQVRAIGTASAAFGVGVFAAEADSNPTVGLIASAIRFGPGGATSPDTSLNRSAANVLQHYMTAWGTFQAAAFTVSSDRKIKTLVKPIQKTAKVDLNTMLLDAGQYTYHLEGDKDTLHYGLIADELPPQVVTMGTQPDDDGNPGEELCFVDLFALSTSIVGLIQDLDARLKTLEGVKPA